MTCRQMRNRASCLKNKKITRLIFKHIIAVTFCHCESNLLRLAYQNDLSPPWFLHEKQFIPLHALSNKCCPRNTTPPKKTQRRKKGKLQMLTELPSSKHCLPFGEKRWIDNNYYISINAYFMGSALLRGILNLKVATAGFA